MLKKTTLFLLYLLPIFGSSPIDLGPYEKSLYSEYGEDGVLAKFFRLCPPEKKYLVHLGACDGLGTTNTHLLLLQEWKGLLIDRGHENKEINLQKKFITAQNINEILKSNEVPSEFELLVIDLHYNDFHIWNSIDNSYRPALVLIEYNGTLDSTEDKVIDYRPYYAGDYTDYFGASITALQRLGKKKGYNLIYAEKGGAYLFFLREDLLTDMAFANSNDVKKLYHPAKKQFSADERNRTYTTSADIIGNP
jgi:hypothetical protein